MSRVGLIILTVFTMLLNPVIAQDNTNTLTQDSLWSNAVKISSELNDWYPASLVISEVTKNNKGKIENQSETIIAISLDSLGEFQIDLLSASENGKDITEKLLKTFEDDKYEYIPLILTFSPLDESIQDSIKAYPTGKQDAINGIHCMQYKFTSNLDSLELKGSVWLESFTGYPVMIEIKLPAGEEDGLKMSNILSKTYFSSIKDNHFKPETEILTMDLKASMLFVTWKGKTVIETKLSDYKQIK